MADNENIPQVAPPSGPTPEPKPAAVAEAAQSTENTPKENNHDSNRSNTTPSSSKPAGGSTRGDDKPHKRKHTGFGAAKGEVPDKREQVAQNREAKRRRIIEGENGGHSYMSITFPPEEIAAEQRRPKRKVAVLIGYAGTGYHGIQINHKERTIEGDLFAAFVKAGAISKVNADDPKKSSLVRCARTDKGVHAAGNVLSLKLIVEDPDIVEKINSHLPDQIRVWGIQRTSNGFSCYQACDSRWYEYLMPSYSLLPPHPKSFLGKKIIESAKEKGVYDEYMSRLDDVKDFWEEVEKNDIKPILDRLDPSIKPEVLRKLYASVDQVLTDETEPTQDNEGMAQDVEMKDASEQSTAAQDGKPEAAKADSDTKMEGTSASDKLKDTKMEDAKAESKSKQDSAFTVQKSKDSKSKSDKDKELTPVELALREIKAAYVAAKRRYRVTPVRIQRLQEALNQYLGTRNFHNYTVMKAFKDASAKRHIKSFQVNPNPIQIRDTEWLSLKVHGQSFMMHQIRKMVAMAVMVVRCGAPLDIINQSYGPRRISIPKAPGLGLMLERPMFTEYNKKAVTIGREPIDFAKYEDKIKAFKDEHIYRRMFELEEKENSFHLFFNQVDNYRTDYFLWVTAGGLEASHERSERTERVPKALQAELGDDADGVEERGD